MNMQISLYCDVLIVGGGIAGLTAAVAASEEGKSVILCDENNQFGGVAIYESKTKIENKPIAEFIAEQIAQLQKNKNATLLLRTTAFGYFQQNMVALTQRVGDHLEVPQNVRERLKCAPTSCVRGIWFL